MNVPVVEERLHNELPVVRLEFAGIRFLSEVLVRIELVALGHLN